jgi:hypothetical protein
VTQSVGPEFKPQHHYKQTKDVFGRQHPCQGEQTAGLRLSDVACISRQGPCHLVGHPIEFPSPTVLVEQNPWLHRRSPRALAEAEVWGTLASLSSPSPQRDHTPNHWNQRHIAAQGPTLYVFEGGYILALKVNGLIRRSLNIWRWLRSVKSACHCIINNRLHPILSSQICKA